MARLPGGARMAPESEDPERWQVYLVRCADGTLYCGVTTDPARREAMHNGLLPGGAKYTRSRRPVVLEAVSPRMGRSGALRLEAAVKKLPAVRKRSAVEEGEAALTPRVAGRQSS